MRLFPEHFPALQLYPLCAVAHRVDAAVQSPARLPCDVAPAPPRFLDAAEGGSIHRGGAVLGLCGDQPHFPPVARVFALSGAGLHRADHRAVGLGDHMRRADLGQHPEGLRVLLLQLFARPLRVGQGGVAHRADTDLKAVVLQDTVRCPRKGMFHPKVRQHALQPPRPSPWRHAQACGQGAQVALALAAPDPVVHRHHAKDAPPRQRFFLRLRTVVS